MNKTTHWLGIVLLGAFLSSGCAMATGGQGSVTGLIYSAYKTSGVVGAAQPAKSGQACATSILGIVATGDASLVAAKTAAGVSQVAHVDHEVTGILGVYAKSCTIVYGQ